MLAYLYDFSISFFSFQTLHMRLSAVIVVGIYYVVDSSSNSTHYSTFLQTLEVLRHSRKKFVQNLGTRFVDFGHHDITWYNQKSLNSTYARNVSQIEELLHFAAASPFYALFG